MGRRAAHTLIAGSLAAAAVAGAGAAAATTAAGAARPAATAATALHECQHPVVTGVEVYALKGVSVATACPVALALFKWENQDGHSAQLYGCHRPNPNAAGYPYLRMHSFDGWAISLRGKPYGAFTMSRGGGSFQVTGTDFPLNCS